MAQIEIPFGGDPVSFEVADQNLIEVLRPVRSLPLADLDKEIRGALDNPISQKPLQKWVKPTDRVILISDDNTRLTPADRIIPPLLNRLNRAGVSDKNISCIS